MESLTSEGFNSARLEYKRIQNFDLDDYIKWYTNSDVMKYVTPKPFTAQETEQRFKTKLEQNASSFHPLLGWYSIKLKNSSSTTTTTFVGIGKLTTQDEKKNEGSVGYGMMPEFWGNGYGTEMLKALVDVAKRIPELDKLTADIHPDNLASKKILTNAGFVHCGSSVTDNFPTEHYYLNI